MANGVSKSCAQCEYLLSLAQLLLLTRILEYFVKFIDSNVNFCQHLIRQIQ